MNIFCHRNKHQVFCVLIYCVVFLCFYSLPVSAQAEESYKFEELVIEAGSCENLLRDLDYFALELQNNPTAKGYIIYYGGKTYDFYESPKSRLPRRGEAEFRAKSIKRYLRFDSERNVIVNGGYREKFTFEFWIVPDGAEPPKPTPTVKATEIKFRKGKIKNTDDIWNCIF